jgi:hypothetical protein
LDCGNTDVYNNQLTIKSKEKNLKTTERISIRIHRDIEEKMWFGVG